jgi:hypothetical protein
MGLVAAGRLDSVHGLGPSVMGELMLYFNTQSFLTAMGEAPWAWHEERPVVGSAGCSVTAFLGTTRLRSRREVEC